jgi:hypothetical protein
MAERGDVILNSQPYRLDLASYRVSDIVDFSPRAATPGGSILHSELGLYQPLLLTDWRHGFGFAWYEDAAGYLRTDGNLDTRHAGVIMLYTAITPITQASLTNVAVDGGFIIFANALFAYGSNGLWAYTGTSAASGWAQKTKTLAGTVAITNGTNTLTGTGTTFLTGLAVDDTITVNGETRQVSSITDNLTATVSSNWTSTASGQNCVITFNRPIKWAMATGSYLFFSGDGYRIRKMDSAGSITNAGLDQNSVDYNGGFIASGRMYFLKDQTSRLHHTNQEDASDLEGTTADTEVIYVGGGGYINLGHFSYAGKVYIMRVDGLWMLDTAASVASKVLDFANEVSTTNFRGVAIHNGFAVFPIRDRIYQWNGVRLADVTPRQISDQFPYKVYGRFDNLVAVGRFLYCTARTSDSTEGVTHYEDLLCFDGVGWTKLARLVDGTSGTVSAMNYDVVNNRLWVQFDAATDSVAFFQFQNLSEYPYASFPTTGTHAWYSSRLDMGFRRVSKSVPSLLIEGSNLTANRHLKIYYAIDGGSFTAWGGTDGVTNLVTASGVTELENPLGTTGSTIEFKYMVLRVDLVTDSAAQTPVLESLTVRFLMRPDVKYGYSFLAHGASRVRYGQHEDPRTAKALIDDLRTARDSKSPLNFEDLYGVSHKVYVSSVQERAVERHGASPNEGNVPDIEQVVQISLVEV